MRHIALLIESSRSYGRGLLSGVATYIRAHGGWSVRHQEMSINASTPRWLRDWQGDGILARIETPAMVKTIGELGIPTVDLRCWNKIQGVPRIDTDDHATVALSVDHLRDRGFRRFAYCGFAEIDYSVRRLRIFRDYLNRFGIQPSVYESRGSLNPTTTGAELRGMLDASGVTRWLKQLEKPVGLLASNDIRAQHVLQCCLDAEIAVPDDVAVVGVDNDDVICPLCLPGLSSVEPDTQAIGYQAAALLDDMMNGGAAPKKKILVAPKRVVVRRSSDVVPVEDRSIATAYRYLREHACDGISVEDVLQTAAMSRRTLERRMQKYFGRSPAELIAEIRLARIKQLLEETNFPLRKIARLTGYVHQEHMAMFFRKQVGLPPGKYRESCQLTRGAVDK